MSAIVLNASSIQTMAYSFLFAYKNEFFIAFVSIFVGRKLVRAAYGGKYTSKGLIVSPLAYLAFTGTTLVGIHLEGLLICSVGFAFGLGLSSVLKNQVHFFEKNGSLYYRRSLYIVLAWTVAYISRLYLLLYYDVTAGLVLSVILSYFTGLITGEAFQIAVQKRIFDYRHGLLASQRAQNLEE